MVHLKKETKTNPEEFFNICFNHSVAFVTYCLPGSMEVNTLVQYKSKPREVQDYSDFNNWKGFLIAPFNADNYTKPLLLEPDLEIADFAIPDSVLIELEQSQRLKSDVNSITHDYSTKKEEFIEQVELIKEQIKTGAFEKIVLSRVHQNPYGKRNSYDLFESIRVKYPTTMRYVFFLPGYGYWIGATPEPFLILHNGTIELTSMAGTRRVDEAQVQNIEWNPKELQEQKYVTNYIEKTLNKFDVAGYLLEGPFNYRASNIIHLKSVFRFKDNELTGRLGEFISELMPTPSVAGSPKEDAIAFIRSIEKHDRQFYSGLLGPVNMNGFTKLYVNLRCMKFDQNNAFLYAGAGITSGSIAENEWEETNQKLFAMLSVLKGDK